VTPVIATEDRDFIALAREMLPSEPWDDGTWVLWTNTLKEKSGRKGKALFLPLRLALTGRPDGPELRTLLPLLGRTASLARLS
jgi:glutamyl-tRNA synthetase